MSTQVGEPHESPWMFVVSPLIWAAHFLACYATAAIWCAKVAGRDGNAATMRLALGSYTLVAIVALALVGWHGLRRCRGAAAEQRRFLGYVTLLLAGLSAVAVAYASFAVAMIETCQ
jgi:hypothetical protein